MGQLVSLDARRKLRENRQALPVTAFIDLGCPFSYLAAERLSLAFTDVQWRPATVDGPLSADGRTPDERTVELRLAAERRAAELRLPLEWPDRFPAPVPAAMRAATYAVDAGRGSCFVLAAGRLAFCGGFDLDDPEVLAEAAAAAGIGLEGCLRAARDPRRDARIEASGRSLAMVGVDHLPALQIGRTLLWGEGRISAYLSAGAAALTMG